MRNWLLLLSVCLLAAVPAKPSRLDVARLRYPAASGYPTQSTYSDCTPVVVAIACQKITSVHNGVDCGPLSGRFIALCGAANDNISPDIPQGPYLCCGMVADWGSCAESMCGPDEYLRTEAMIADAAPRKSRLITWEHVDTTNEVVELLRTRNAAVVTARLNHAYAIIGVNPDGSVIVVDPYRGTLLQMLGFGARVFTMSRRELDRLWSGMLPGEAAGVEI